MISAATEPARISPTPVPPNARDDGVEAFVDQDQRRQQAERQHGAGDRVADAGDVDAGVDEGVAQIARRRDRREADRQHERGRGGGERDGGEGRADQAGIEAERAGRARSTS